jgi:hypothetical protein
LVSPTAASRFSDTGDVIPRPGLPRTGRPRRDPAGGCGSSPIGGGPASRWRWASAGSTFKRPQNGYAAALIEKAG